MSIQYRTRNLLLLLLMILFLTSCFLKQDRTTVVYGTITDEKGLPVDSIMVVIDGIKLLHHTQLGQAYSNKIGIYEIVVTIPKKFSSVDVGVPFYPIENAKYNKYYKGVNVKKNSQEAVNCCNASIGEKTKYDFQLISK